VAASGLGESLGDQLRGGCHGFAPSFHPPLCGMFR
jgi:hypothetical protein